MQAVSKINFPGWVGVGGWRWGWLGYMKIKPTQPQLGLGLAELGNIRVDQQSFINKYFLQFMFPIVMSVEVVTKNYDENL